jgi:hypothetical protein
VGQTQNAEEMHQLRCRGGASAGLLLTSLLPSHDQIPTTLPPPQNPAHLELLGGQRLLPCTLRLLQHDGRSVHSVVFPGAPPDQLQCGGHQGGGPGGGVLRQELSVLSARSTVQRQQGASAGVGGGAEGALR